jgi:hypothetical protein
MTCTITNVLKVRNNVCGHIWQSLQGDMRPFGKGNREQRQIMMCCNQICASSSSRSNLEPWYLGCTSLKLLLAALSVRGAICNCYTM